MSKPILPFLELMLLRSCNLSCKGCTTFSDIVHKGGYMDWEVNRHWLLSWSKRIEIQAVGVMGGEPLMHPRLEQWILGMRDVLPKAQIRFVTNGLLLERHKKIIDLLHDLGNSVLKISVHVEDDRINSIIKFVMNRYDWRPVTEFNINRWSTGNEFKFQINRPERFYKTFRNEYDNMLPHDNNPVDAFKLCVQKKCPLLFDGKLFKCGTAALTPEILKTKKNKHQDQWRNYIGTGLSIDCDDEDLMRFIFNFNKPHAICRQCPTESDLDSIIDHQIHVDYK